MEGHFSTDQSPQWAVVPMEEEEEEEEEEENDDDDDDPHTTSFIVLLISMRYPIRKTTTDELIPNMQPVSVNVISVVFY